MISFEILGSLVLYYLVGACLTWQDSYKDCRGALHTIAWPLVLIYELCLALILDLLDILHKKWEGYVAIWKSMDLSDEE